MVETATSARNPGALSAQYRFESDNAPVEAPQRSSASATQFYAVNDERNMQRKSYRVASVTAGDYNDDSRYAEWQQVNGNVVPCRAALTPNLSELFSAYAITLDADRASSAATNHALQLAATDLEYEVTRVKSPVLGRDLNPMGRGDGTYYCNGGNAADGANVVVLGAKPAFSGAVAYGFGSGMGNYDAEECAKFREEQERMFEEDPACEKKLTLQPIACCVEECGFGLPDGEQKRALRSSCECCCCLAGGCGDCILPLPAECIVCCKNGDKCDCMPDSVEGGGGKALGPGISIGIDLPPPGRPPKWPPEWPPIPWLAMPSSPGGCMHGGSQPAGVFAPGLPGFGPIGEFERMLEEFWKRFVGFISGGDLIRSVAEQCICECKGLNIRTLLAFAFEAGLTKFTSWVLKVMLMAIIGIFLARFLGVIGFLVSVILGYVMGAVIDLAFQNPWRACIACVVKALGQRLGRALAWLWNETTEGSSWASI